MKAVMMVGIVVWTLAGVLSSSAWTQARLTEAAEQDRWDFPPGRIELGVQLGGGFSVNEKTRFATEFALLPRLGYVS